ncbi:MAG: helix-turn-helix domain-containing protein [Ruminococcus sp.]|nr:helix-turn-helix domain-containing protein [Ruminococcus sp.]
MNFAKIYTPEEARKVLRIGRTRLYNLLRQGKLKSIKNGRRFLIPQECIAEYIAVNIVPSNKEVNY